MKINLRKNPKFKIRKSNQIKKPLTKKISKKLKKRLRNIYNLTPIKNNKQVKRFKMRILILKGV